jgi:hypothetical protein
MTFTVFWDRTAAPYYRWRLRFPDGRREDSFRTRREAWHFARLGAQIAKDKAVRFEKGGFIIDAEEDYREEKI